MDEILTHERKRKWFLWGTVLTCTLSIPLIIGMSKTFRGISAEHATGLSAVAGGLAEAYVTFAVVLAFALPITAIFLLSRSFVRGRAARSLFSFSASAGTHLCLPLLGYSSGCIWFTCPALVLTVIRQRFPLIALRVDADQLSLNAITLIAAKSDQAHRLLR